MGEQWALENNIPIKRFPAKWATLGRKAGATRNRVMAAYAEALIAIWDGKSPGTSNMIQEAMKRGLEVFGLGSDGREFTWGQGKLPL